MEYKRLQDCQTPTAAEDKKAIPWEEEPAVSASKVRKLFLFSLLALAMTILFVQLGRKFLPQYVAGNPLSFGRKKKRRLLFGQFLFDGRRRRLYCFLVLYAMQGSCLSRGNAACLHSRGGNDADILRFRK